MRRTRGRWWWGGEEGHPRQSQYKGLWVETDWYEVNQEEEAEVKSHRSYYWPGTRVRRPLKWSMWRS